MGSSLPILTGRRDVYLKTKIVTIDPYRSWPKVTTKGSKVRRQARVDNLDLSLLLHQQAILIQSGLPLEESLRMTIEQAETDKQRRLVESWRSEITEGRSFSEALRRSPIKFPKALLLVLALAKKQATCIIFYCVYRRSLRPVQRIARLFLEHLSIR